MRECCRRVEHIVYIFEGFSLDAGRRQLSSSGGVVVPLNSRAMEALVMLVSRAGELVTKRQLLEGVWPGAVVEDNNINQCILAIRKALGESAGSNRFVMTVPGRGYRFVAPVMQQKRESPEAGAQDAPSATRAGRWNILVAPAVAAALMLALLSQAPSPRDPLQSSPELRELTGSRELVVHLHSHDPTLAAPQTQTLLACLRQRPDLHLRVEVHVVGGEADSPMWSGHYIAGAQDLLSGRDADDAPGNACQRLGAR
ncbi:MAG TPA: transcriptional regulator [Steroidobacteraceae bacterium]|nr:transcriptional regulator [Steroidobacteraceae bacterium]